MHMTTALAILLVLCSDLCLTIKVPVVWNNDASEVKQHTQPKNEQDEFSIDSFNAQYVQKSVPVEYFEYTAKKPQFAVDIAKLHGVQAPEDHYKAYPISPVTGNVKPQLGNHRLLNEDNANTRPFQQYVNKNKYLKNHVTPVSSNYEVFHPYKAETPALQAMYKDPVLNKIRNDLENSKNRLQTHEKDAGQPDVTKSEYLENPKQTDERFLPQKNIPAPFEIHKAQRRPLYYKPVPIFNNRDHILNQKLRHQWNQGHKIRPIHYRPVKNHLYKLRQNHALKYDDERNEYPQIQITENQDEPQDGYDIYEKGRDKYVQLRNNVDESINKVVEQNRPAVYQKLEIQNNEPANNEEEDEFVPIKNYAQVRKTETTKHLPRIAALEDAETYDEIKNAPRLREAVKSTKAQTVYTEEGYEDSAYDHAGELKHASDHEAHGGYLKEKELSEGKYKIPSASTIYEDGKGSAYRDQVLHGEKYKNNDKENQKETEEEDYTENEQAQLVEASIYQNDPDEEANERNTREKSSKNDTEISDTFLQHDVNKREANLEVPAIDFNSNILSEKEIISISKQKLKPTKGDIVKKYPYYFKNIKVISKDSPLRYAENLKLIPKKSKGGTEFYDSRSSFECPEVEDVDPLPEKLKQDENPNDEDANESEKGEKSFDTAKSQPRLKGLGDKIDCFKAKYFGENPLDSPFFKEEVISNPEPVTAPNLGIYKLSHSELQTAKSKSKNVTKNLKKIKDESESDLITLLSKLRSDKGTSMKKNMSNELNKGSILSLQTPQNNTLISNTKNNTKNNLQKSLLNESNLNDAATKFFDPNKSIEANGVTYSSFQNKEQVTKLLSARRKKRATPFVYEPYKIIKDSQVQDSKKTTTSSNISPLIKQLQSSRVVDRVTKPNQDKEQLEKYVKRNVNTRAYKDIGAKDRERLSITNGDDSTDSSFVDVSVDHRRGEPRYELRPANHKPRYTPVENKKTMSMEDYTAQSSTENSTDKKVQGKMNPERQNWSRQARRRKSTEPPFFDVSKYIPQTTEVQNVAASNSVRKTVTTTTIVPETKTNLKREDGSDGEYYEEYEDGEEDDEEEETKILSTSTPTAVSSRKPRITTTEQTHRKIGDTEVPKLKLVTRFRNYNPETSTEIQKQQIETQKSEAPKYREKKKKSSKRTFVTDTKKYDEGDDDMRKDEVDAMIGVKQDMDDFMPLYNKENRNKKTLNEPQSSEESYEDYEDHGDEDDDDDNDDVGDDEDDEDHVENDDEEGDDYDSDEEKLQPETEKTTPEPMKRTLSITTDAPVPTTAARSAKLEIKPIVTKKKIEIHKELPVNKSSPHITEFKEDITEVEIIKEIPPTLKKKLQKNIEALEFYKDDNLAKNINKLGDVEIFKENLDLKNGPKHGGNYRSINEEPSTVSSTNNGDIEVLKHDAEASQSENKKHVKVDDNIQNKRIRGRNFNSRNHGRSSKYIELSDPPNTAMHGGNLRHQSKDRRHGSNNRSEKLIELQDDRDDERRDPSSNSRGGHGYSGSRNERPMHGGNYRSAKIVEVVKTPELNEEKPKVRSKETTRNSAVLLNSFVQAAPILTTTPSYILDPSKRMYYYVDF